jgi:glycosyltransferase involved in cell wall biosynthesis
LGSMAARLIVEGARQAAKATPNPWAWHLITCEYPPSVGGVSDYTYLIARELARTGNEVHVWCPRADGDSREAPGVAVHRELGRFAPSDLRRAGKLLNEFRGPRRLLVQWVPQGYGYCSVNIFFCLWLWMRARIKGDEVQIMFHEVWLAFGGSWKKNLAASVHRVMVKILKLTASQIWIAGERWRACLRGARAPVRWLPVPSNVPCNPPPQQIVAIRRHFGAPERRLVGHFGLGNRHVEGVLRSFIPSLLRDLPDVVFLLMGQGSREFAREIRGAYPEIGGRVSFTGVLSSESVAAHIAACDLLVHPYPDGVSGRRGAAMAVLANGRPLLTTCGCSTEQIWYGDRIAMTPSDDTNALIAGAKQLLNDEGLRTRVAAAGRRLYETMFDVSASVGALHDTSTPVRPESVGMSARWRSAAGRVDH